MGRQGRCDCQHATTASPSRFPLLPLSVHSRVQSRLFHRARTRIPLATPPQTMLNHEGDVYGAPAHQNYYPTRANYLFQLPPICARSIHEGCGLGEDRGGSEDSGVIQMMLDEHKCGHARDKEPRVSHVCTIGVGMLVQLDCTRSFGHCVGAMQGLYCRRQL